jgi:hypothetical protein
VALNTKWTDIDKALSPSPQSASELHERVVQDVAQARFEFPTPEFPSYRAFVNVPEKNLPVQDPQGNELVPDIVIVDTPSHELKIFAQIETAETVTEERARSVWLPFSKLPNAAFYLYIPVGYGAIAKKLAKQAKARVYGYRTWRYVPQGLEINEISDPPEVMVRLMPPFIRRIMRGD